MNPRKFTGERLQEIIDFYQSGIGADTIGKMFNVCPITITNSLRRENIRIRTENYNHKSLFNETVFENIDTEEKAYWLGFLMADGYVTKDNRIGLHLKYGDKDHIEKFKIFIGSNLPIVIRDKFLIKTQKTYKQACLRVTSRQMVKDLFNYGMIPNKSLIIKFPNNISEPFLNPFIRGLFDGDGTLGKYYIKQRQYRYWITQCTFSGTEDLMRNISMILNRNVGISLRTPFNAKNLFLLSYSAQQAKKILNWLYQKATVYLDRKFYLYQSIMEVN